MLLELCKASFPENIMDRITVSTVHRLQGDEVDLVVFVNLATRQNPGSTSFFNTRNLINVAISRAKRQVLIVHPEHITTDLSERELFGSFPKDGITRLTIPQVSQFVVEQGILLDRDIEVKEFKQVQFECIDESTEWKYLFHVSSSSNEKVNPVSVIVRKDY
jgi:superfamily I DNA/RNA helicase